MSRFLPRLLAVTGTLAVCVPAAAHAQLPEDVTRIQNAVVELAGAKRNAKPRAERAGRRAERAMRACRTSGPGWRRIRAVRDRSQRDAYARGARILWGKLSGIAAEGAAVAVFQPAFDRYLMRLERPASDALLEAGMEASRGRVAYVKAAYGFGSCRTFERLLTRVREFRIGGSDGVSGDYRAGRIYNDFAGYVAARQRKADTRLGGSSYRRRLDAARERIVALGGDFGYASYFTAAHSLNN